MAVRGGVGRLDVEDDLVGQPVQVPQRALDRRIDAPGGDARPQAELAVVAVEVVVVEVFAPMGGLAQGVGHQLDRAGLEGPVDLLPREEPLALGVQRLAGGRTSQGR